MTDTTSTQRLDLFDLPLGQIRPSDTNPRRRPTAAELAELAGSIKAQGVLEPLLVRPIKDGGFELVAGERRLRAAKLAGLATIPALVRPLDDRAALEAQLTENLAREDLSPLEEAHGFYRYQRVAKVSQKELAKVFGLTQGTVSGILRLLELPDRAKALFGNGELTAAHGRQLVRLLDKPAAMAVVLDWLTAALRGGTIPATRQFEAVVDKQLAVRGELPKRRARTVAKRQRRAVAGDKDRLTKLVTVAHDLAVAVNALSRVRPLKVPAHVFERAARLLSLISGRGK